MSASTSSTVEKYGSSIDSDIVKKQMHEAGFKLIEEAFYLKNPKDTLDTNVFAKGVRGNTDRFIYKFVKM